MRQFVISEDVLGAVAQCIGAATHAVPYGQVAALIQRLDSLPQAAVGENSKAAPGQQDPDKAAPGESAIAAPGFSSPQAKNV